jgi:hypothetical protein
MAQIKRLFLDIETSFFIAATFSLWPKSISHDNILQDWHIICAAWKWEHENKIHKIGTYTKNDKKVVKALRAAIVEADEIVYHNGKKFDFKKLNTRVIAHRLDPMPKPREVDTLIQARKHCAFTSNRLDYIGKFLGVGQKVVTSQSLWLRALNGEREAVDEMMKYCPGDVILLESVFKVLQPYIDVGYNQNLDIYMGDRCPRCQSSNKQQRGWSNTLTCRYKRFQCKNCKGWFQSKTKETLCHVLAK